MNDALISVVFFCSKRKIILFYFLLFVYVAKVLHFRFRVIYLVFNCHWFDKNKCLSVYCVCKSVRNYASLISNITLKQKIDTQNHQQHENVIKKSISYLFASMEISLHQFEPTQPRLEATKKTPLQEYLIK